MVNSWRNIILLLATTKGWLADFHTTINHNKTTQHSWQSMTTHSQPLTTVETTGHTFKLCWPPLQHKKANQKQLKVVITATMHGSTTAEPTTALMRLMETTSQLLE